MDKSSLLYFVNTRKLKRAVNGICRAWYFSSCTMMAKPIKTLEMHYSMIQFFIINNYPQLATDTSTEVIVVLVCTKTVR